MKTLIHGKSVEKVDILPAALMVSRLALAIRTHTNDDRSAVGTKERDLFVERDTIMREAVALIEEPAPLSPSYPRRGREMGNVRPVRLQLSRKRGFNLQAHSLATNGLPAINVARPGRYGNPYFPGCGIGYGAIDEAGNLYRFDVREPETQVRWFRKSVEERAHSPGAYDRYLGPLRGKNAACWCAVDAKWCHADVLLDLANRPICEAA